MVYIYIWSPFHCIANLFNVHQLEFFSHDRIGNLTHCSHATYEIITSLGELQFKYLLITNFTACTPERAGVTLSPMWTVKQRSNDWEFQPVSPPSRLISDNYNAWISHTVFTCMVLFHIFSLYTDGVHPIFFIQHTFRELPACLISLKILLHLHSINSLGPKRCYPAI